MAAVIEIEGLRKEYRSVRRPPIAAVGKLLPLGWAMEVVDRAAIGDIALAPAGMAVALSAVAFAVGVVLLRRIDLLARKRGTLRLR